MIGCRLYADTKRAPHAFERPTFTIADNINKTPHYSRSTSLSPTLITLWIHCSPRPIELLTSTNPPPPPAMAGIQLRDEAVRDRIRAAQEFLDPSV